MRPAYIAAGGVFLAIVAIALLVVVLNRPGNPPWTDNCIDERSNFMPEDAATQRPSDDYMQAVLEKYEDLLWDFPHSQGFYAGDFYDAEYNEIDGYGITVKVLELTDQSTLPEEQRIPACLDGVPVRFLKVGLTEALGG